MTGDEAARTVKVLATMFRVEVQTTEAEVWMRVLSRLDVEVANLATERIVLTHTNHMPTVAAFMDAYRAEERASKPTWRDEPLPLAAPRAAGDAAQYLAEARAKLRALGAKP